MPSPDDVDTQQGEEQNGGGKDHHHIDVAIKLSQLSSTPTTSVWETTKKNRQTIKVQYIDQIKTKPIQKPKAKTCKHASKHENTKGTLPLTSKLLQSVPTWSISWCPNLLTLLLQNVSNDDDFFHLRKRAVMKYKVRWHCNSKKSSKRRFNAHLYQQKSGYFRNAGWRHPNCQSTRSTIWLTNDSDMQTCCYSRLTKLKVIISYPTITITFVLLQTGI